MKALGIAMKLTLQGQNQLIYPQTSVFAMVVIICILTQMNYLNKVLSWMFYLNRFEVIGMMQSRDKGFKAMSKVLYLSRYA